MDVQMNDQTAPRIAAIVGRMLDKRGAARTVTSAQNLREAGLTSLDMVNLMLAIEGEFDVFIPQEQMTPENFRCLDAIESLVDSLLSVH